MISFCVIWETGKIQKQVEKFAPARHEQNNTGACRSNNHLFDVYLSDSIYK